MKNLLLKELELEIKKRPSSNNPLIIYAGFISNYPIVISHLGYRSAYNINISANKEMLENHANILVEKLNNLKNVSDTKIIDSYLSLTVGKGIFTKKKLKLAIEETIDSILELFLLNSILPGDFLLGKYDDSIALYKIGEEYKYLTEESKEIIEGDFKKKKGEKKIVKQNIPLGIIGAILGAFIGAMIFTIVSYFTNYYTYFSIIILMFSYSGYRLMGKKVKFFGSFLSLIISILFLYPSIFLKYTKTSYETLKTNSLDLATIKNTLYYTWNTLSKFSIKKINFERDITDATKTMATFGIIILFLIIEPIKSEIEGRITIKKIE